MLSPNLRLPYRKCWWLVHTVISETNLAQRESNQAQVGKVTFPRLQCWLLGEIRLKISFFKINAAPYPTCNIPTWGHSKLSLVLLYGLTESMQTIEQINCNVSSSLCFGSPRVKPSASAKAQESCGWADSLWEEAREALKCIPQCDWSVPKEGEGGRGKGRRMSPDPGG